MTLKAARCRCVDRFQLADLAIDCLRHNVAEWIDDQSTFRVAYESTTSEGIMRFVQAIILLIFLGMLGLFAVQNTEDITVTFWTWKITGPVALLTIAAYVLGMLSGWTVVSFFTRSLRRMSERSAN